MSSSRRLQAHADEEGVVKVVSRRTLWEGHYLRSVLIEYLDGRDHDSETGEAQRYRHWETIERVGCSGVVAIVPFTDDGSVILIRQYRPPVDRNVIELPAGLVDIGELPEDTARRELIEETGYDAKAMEFLISGPASSGLSSEILDVYVATGLHFVGIGQRDEAENMEVLKVPLEELEKETSRLVEQGDYVDLKVHGMIRLAREFLRKKSA